MLTNQDMKADRFARWHRARQRAAEIKTALLAGRIVQVTTYTKCWRYKRSHADLFVGRWNGLYVRHGRELLNIDYCDVRFF